MSDENRRYDEETHTIKTISGDEVKVVLRAKDGVVRRITVGDSEYIHRDAFENLIIDQRRQSATIAQQGGQVVQYRQELENANARQAEIVTQYQQYLETANAKIKEISHNLEESTANEARMLDLIREYEARRPEEELATRINDVQRRETQVANLETLLFQKREEIQAQLDEHRTSVERECASRIKDAETMVAHAKAKQQKTDAAYLAAMEALTSSKGYIRVLCSVTDKILKYVKDDLDCCTSFIDEVRQAYAAEGAGLILGILYSGKLKLRNESADILAGIHPEKASKLKAKVFDAKTTTVVGYDEALKAHYIEPITSNSTKVAHFCLIGIPSEGGRIDDELLQRIRNTGKYLSDRMCSDYTLLQMTEWETYIKDRFERLEHQIAALKP